MDERLDELDGLYLEWLYRQFGNVRLKNPARTYWSLTRQLYTTEFVWFIPNDDNRAVEGIALREEFVYERDIENPDPIWMEMGCSMLEMLLALSRRLAFEDSGEPRDWFWQLLDNLGLSKHRDLHCGNKNCHDEIAETLDRVIWRLYEPDGSGGLFPLKYPEQDQRDIEIWYQLNAYLMEND